MEQAVSPRSTMDRRSFLKRVGATAGAAVVVVAGGVVWRAVDQSVFAAGTGPAYEPWRAELNGAAPMSLVAAAILAANAHNTQPWAFAVRADTIDVFADRRRSIGTMDPLGRELLISLGCALENLLIAASAHGYETAVEVEPNTAGTGHLATIRLERGVPHASPHFAAIPNRHTNRAAYDVARALPSSELEAMSGIQDDPRVSLVWLTSAAERDRFGQMTIDATAAILSDPEQARDDFAWYRQDWHEIERHRDGITMDAAGLGEPARSLIRLLPSSSQEQMQTGWLDATRDRHVATASAYGLIQVQDRSDAAQLMATGRLLQRIHLHATTRGIALQPLNQVFERADRESTTRGNEFTSRLNEIASEGWRAVTAFRVGYPTAQAGLSPRRALRDVLR